MGLRLGPEPNDPGAQTERCWIRANSKTDTGTTGRPAGSLPKAQQPNAWVVSRIALGDRDAQGRAHDVADRPNRRATANRAAIGHEKRQ